MLSPTAACLPCATVRGPVGFALTNSIRILCGFFGLLVGQRLGGGLGAHAQLILRIAQGFENEQIRLQRIAAVFGEQLDKRMTRIDHCGVWGFRLCVLNRRQVAVGI